MYGAHINPYNSEVQSVKQHLKNVSELSREYAAKISLPTVGELIGLLHDLGKICERFNNYLHYSHSHPEDKSLRGTVNHSTAGAKLIYDSFFHSKDLFEKFTSQLIALVICSHHGGLIDCIDLDGIDIFTHKLKTEQDICYEEALSNFYKECIDYSAIKHLFSNAVKELKDVLSELNRMDASSQNRNFLSGMLVKYLYSCLIDADRYDTFCFMENKEPQKKVGVASLWEELQKTLEFKLSQHPMESEIDILRAEVSCLCKESGKRESGIYQLSVPTGGGKTLSSLRYALEHARKYNKDRIFYIIPFITITEQNAKEIKDILGREDIVLEHHSNVVIDNNDEDYKLLTERWESPIIFTTMVQFMNTLFEGGTQSIRRLHNLANSVIIFDEIQTLPIKSVHLFNNAINFLSYICNASVVLCTATQPLLEITDKPVKLCENPNIVPDIYKRFEQFKRVELKDKTINGGYSIDLLKDFITEKSESSKSILVIVNTKSVARNLFERLNKIMDTIEKGKKCTLFHLSTNMCPINRLDVLKKMKEKLGKERLICVSTQLVEAGVNISFECVIRSLAGMDSLSQAAGRCNRHGESSCKEAYIVNINEENIDKLLDIKTGQDKTLRVLYEFKENPAHFEYDLLSQKTMDTYYKYYFHERKPEMDYCLAGEYKGKALYDILAANDVGREAYYGRNGRNPEAILRQAFKTAGRSFSFIDQNTTAILVPYGKGKELITKLNGVCSLSDLKVCLREAQHYIVNLYDTDRRKLEKINAITKLANGDILALKESFYDEEIGISFEKLPMEFYEY